MGRADKHKRDWKRWRSLLAGVVAVVVLFSLGYLLVTTIQLSRVLEDTRAELDAQEAENEALREQLGREQERVGELEEVEAEEPVETAPLWSTEGLVDQPRMAELIPSGQAVGLDPGTTDWKPADLDLSQEFAEGGYENPGSLLAALITELRLAEQLGVDVWEVTTRVLAAGANEAVGMILAWGLKDDAIAGIDYRITLLGNESGWGVSAVEQREHCRRGVTDDCERCT